MSAQTKNVIISKLLRTATVHPNSVSKDRVTAWFPSGKARSVEKALRDLEAAPDSPVIAKEEGKITLESVESAKKYLLKHGSDDFTWFLEDQESGKTEDRENIYTNEDYIQVLKEELEEISDSAEDWRKEARFRQRMSLLIGVGSFVIGIITGVLI